MAEITQEQIIQENQSFTIENYQITIQKYLGLLNPDIYYFQVDYYPLNQEKQKPEPGLLRVGSSQSGLNRELQIREILKDYKLITPVLAQTQLQAATIKVNATNNQIINYSDNLLLENQPEFLETESNYLEEELYPELPLNTDLETEKILLLTQLPQENLTLETWLQTELKLEEIVSTITQICQCFLHISKQNWCVVDIQPKLIQVSKPIQLFDLSSVYPIGEPPASGIIGNYCAPELATGETPNPLMSSYTIAALLYQSIHQKLPQTDETLNLSINPIPRIYQLLKIALSPIPEERFPLSQLLNLLIDTRKTIANPNIQWNIASQSSLGLNPERLQNEDNYGVYQQQISNNQTLLIGVVADGMGGMQGGEIASQIAVSTILSEPIPPSFVTTSDQERQTWILNLFQSANQKIADTINNGGTTLSLVLAINNTLMLGHVGDSRIYLIHQEQIKQLSEDHSLVSLLVASGEITPEESLTHPDRNILIKSLGCKKQLSEKYVQTQFAGTDNLTLTLNHQDIIILCSDGVWDLVSPQELTQIFTKNTSLPEAVAETINQVIEQGAADNATILALQCLITPDQYYQL
jgi:protein phosphatase